MDKRKIYALGEKHDVLSGLYELATFPTAQALIQTLEAGDLPDVFIAPLRMPDMGGIQLIEWIRGKKIDKPFVILIEPSEKPEALQALKLSAIEFLERPFSAELLKVIVKRAVVSSLYQQLQGSLLAKYRILSQALSDLAKNYEARSLAAEDVLYQSNIITSLGKEQVNRLLKSTRESLELENIVGLTQEHIDELKSLEEEVKAILSSE